MPKYNSNGHSCEPATQCTVSLSGSYSPVITTIIDRIFITKKTQKPYMKKKYKRWPVIKNYRANTRTTPLGKEIANQKVTW